METGTGIAIAGVWLYAMAPLLGNASEIGLKNAVKRAWIMTGIALAFEAIKIASEAFK